MNSKKVTKQKFEVFHKFSDFRKFRSKKKLKKSIFFCHRQSLTDFLPNIIPKFQSNIYSSGQISGNKKMSDLTKKDSPKNKDYIQKLASEIADLEDSVTAIKAEIGTFENNIRLSLNELIFRLGSLNQKVKEKQQFKKAKRLEQKKRGKNYKEPVQLIPQNPIKKSCPEAKEVEKQELKRLYKEAVVQIHPDKLGPNRDQVDVRSATELTSQLNGIYKTGDLEALLYFYQNIILVHPSLVNRELEMPVVNLKIRMASLLSKKEALTKQLRQLESNYLYHVLKTYENPLTFINELKIQFQERIEKLEKRTRKM
jgi:hypothetical protein